MKPGEKGSRREDKHITRVYYMYMYMCVYTPCTSCILTALEFVCACRYMYMYMYMHVLYIVHMYSSKYCVISDNQIGLSLSYLSLIVHSDNQMGPLLQDEDMMTEIGALHKSRRELEQRLHEVSEEKRRLEAELARQREALTKMQDREQDLSKDIETLRDENSHHSGTISKLQVYTFVHVHVHLYMCTMYTGVMCSLECVHACM